MREKRKTSKLMCYKVLKIKRERKEEIPNELYSNIMIIANGKVSNIVV